MTDRELLELAAKAARYTLSAHTQDSTKVCVGGMVWNPLTDDGDALRLAVKLQIHIEPDPLDVVVDWEIGDETTRSIVEYGSSHAGDINAATRRAIVRAAAEIGKATGQEGKA